MQASWVHRYAILVAVFTLFLVVAGASVTSKEAGLSVPDWPLSYGQLMPEMTGGVFFEHGHRMLGAVVGLLTLGLAVWLWRVEERAWMRRLGWIALAAVIAQAVLGGLTVFLLLPPAVSISHACLAQLFFSTTVAIAIFTSPSWKRGPQYVEDHGWPSMRSLAILTPILVLAQLALGAGFRHAVIGVLPHVVGAILVSGVLMLVGIFVLHQFQTQQLLRATAMSMMGITFVQVMLGVGAYVARLEAKERPLMMVLLTVTHVAVGALTMASSVGLSIQILRNVRPAAALSHEHLRATS